MNNQAPETIEKQKVGFDRLLLVVTLLLLCIGVMIISSASTMESMVKYDDSLYQTKKHLMTLVIAVFTGFICAMVPTQVWKEHSIKILFIIFFMLILVLFVGRSINGAKRWLSLGFMNLQPAELLKLFWVLYFSSYVSRKIEQVSKTTKGFVKPFVLVFFFAVLLLFQPDFGSTFVVGIITFGFLWMAGAGFFKYIICGVVLLIAATCAVFFSPYRVQRVTSFLHPWDQGQAFGASYQLTQSLMAYGRGGWIGQGMGNSYQKLGYLPEAHTDFITSIIGEEFGFIGMMVIIFLEAVIIYKALALSIKILKNDAIYQGYVSFGIGFWFLLQTTINIGAASGALPTKGLTLPLVSYGGSSLMVSCAAIAILLRIDYEWRNKIISDKRE